MSNPRRRLPAEILDFRQGSQALEEDTVVGSMTCACRHPECVFCEGTAVIAGQRTQICEVQRLVSRETLHPGAIFFRQGEHTDAVHILRDGYVKLSSTLPDGREQVLCVSNGGALLGFDGLPDQKYGYTAQALTFVTVCSVRVMELWQILALNPRVSRSAILSLSRDLQRSRAHLCDLGMKSALERVASFLLRLGCAPQGVPAPMAQPLSRAEIAEMLGLTIGTVSRSIARLQREGIVRAPRGQLRILDMERLRASAGEAPEPPYAPTARPTTWRE